jgi:hypothetical protein
MIVDKEKTKRTTLGCQRYRYQTLIGVIIKLHNKQNNTAAKNNNKK